MTRRCTTVVARFAASHALPWRRTVAFAAVLAATVLTAHPLAAQNETLLSGSPSSLGGFGGPVFGVSRVAGEGVFISGGRGGAIINRRLLIGGGGYSIVGGDLFTPNPVGNGGPLEFTFNYGGLELGYVTRPNRLVHAPFGALFGGGWAGYADPAQADQQLGERTDESALFVAEPRVGVELNVARWFRVHAAAGYRFVSGSDLAGLDDADLRGATGMLTLKFGLF